MMPHQLRGLSPRTWAVLAIVAAVVLANGLYVLGIVDANPLGPRTGLGQGAPQFVPGQRTIDPNDGFISQALGHRAMLDWTHLDAPWWNPYEGTGTPLAGEMQSAAFFPPTVFTLVSGGQLWEHILLEILAGVATCALLRRLGVGWVAATVGGVAFAVDGTFAWFAHATVNPIPFLPLLLLGIEHAYDAARNGRRLGWRLIALAGALSFLAGFPEVTYINALLAIAWFGWRCGCLRADGPRLRAFVGKATAGVAVGALLSAPLIVPFLDYVVHANLGLHAQDSNSFRLVHEALPQLVLPYVYGPIFAFSDPAARVFAVWSTVGGYLTASLLLFGLLGVISGRASRGLRILLAVAFIVTLSRMYGEPPLIGDPLSLLPGMSRVVFPRYAFGVLELITVLLAALGLDAFLRLAVTRRRQLAVAGVTLLVVVAATLGALPTVEKLSGHHHSLFAAVSVAWAVGIVAAVAALAFVEASRVRLRTALAAGILAVDAVAMFAAPTLSAPRDVTVDTAPVAFLRAHLGTSRFFTLGPIQPNYGAYWSIASLNINDNPIPTGFHDYVHRRLDQIVDPIAFVGNYGGGRNFFLPSPAQELAKNLSGYRQAAVAYVLTPAGQSLPGDRGAFTLVFHSPTTWIYRLSGSQPYFTAGGCVVHAVVTTATRVTCPRPATLVRRETFMPGWSVSVDGHAARLRPAAGGLFQTVSLPAGRHEVRYSFAPPHEGLAWIAFVVGLGWRLSAAVGGRRAPRRNGTEAAAPSR
jgi:hypothetical protein